MNKRISQFSLFLFFSTLIILCSCGGGGHGTTSAHRKGKGRGGDSCPAFHGNKPSGKQASRRVGWF